MAVDRDRLKWAESRPTGVAQETAGIGRRPGIRRYAASPHLRPPPTLPRIYQVLSDIGAVRRSLQIAAFEWRVPELTGRLLRVATERYRSATRAIAESPGNSAVSGVFQIARSNFLRTRCRIVPTFEADGRRGKPFSFLHYEEEDSNAEVVTHN